MPLNGDRLSPASLSPGTGEPDDNPRYPAATMDASEAELVDDVSRGAGESLHDRALVVDGACPLLVVPRYVDWYIEGGVDVVTPTVGGFYPASVALKVIGRWLAYLRERHDLVSVGSAADALAAKARGQTGVVFHFQGTEPIEEDLRHIDAFRQLGVGIIQLTYNVEAAVGYGSQVTDKGLKPFGV